MQRFSPFVGPPLICTPSLCHNRVIYPNCIAFFFFFSQQRADFYISSRQVCEKLKLAEHTSADIDALRDGYRPAAKRGAILFFILAEMALVNSMYQYSLASFLEVFDFSLRKSLPDSILPKRLKNIMNTLTHNVYNYGCTGKGAKHPVGIIYNIEYFLIEGKKTWRHRPEAICNNGN